MSETEPRNLGKSTIQGAVWHYLTFFSGKLMVLVSTAILARLLSPDDFGVVGYALTAISFLDVISDLGIGPALIYYPEEKRTTSTGFWLNLLIGLVIFGITWLLAPLVGLYFRDNRVVTVMQVIGFVYPLRALGDTHDAVLNKRLDFGRIFLPDLMQGLTKGLASVIFALLGYGAWSLIWGYLLGTLVSSITYWLTSPWSPSPIFSWQIARDLLRYGSKIIGVDIVAIFLVNLDYLLIGRYLGASVLGLYTIAFRFPDLLILQFARILSNVLFPVYTHMRQEPGSLARGFFLSTRYLALITVPLGLGLALVAYPLTTAIFSTKWEAAAPVVQALALYTLILSLGYSTGSIYKAEGRPQILTWLGLIRLAMLIPALWWAVTIAKSINMVGWMQALVALAGTIISLYVATRMIKLPVYKLLEAISPAFLAGTVMSVVVYLVIRLSSSLGAWQQLALSIPIGGLIYLATLFTIQRELVTSSWDQFRKALQRN
ncbi:MAG: lipopolysaccharide biosynthesis protein [Chloroflexi bacterium]|nr:lipopolysaccharide biosynthesis protein [Chloroflexota bacterium]